MNQPKFEIYCDFDGTVTQKDVVNLILEKLADPQWNNIEAEWLEGKITSHDCLSKQIPLIQGGWLAVENILNNDVKLEPDFKSFSIWCSKNNIPLYIVSDGLDKVINTVLSKEDIKVASIWSNKLEITEHDKFSISFPRQSKYPECKLGLCKCQVIDQSKTKSMKIVIGDGFSDTCWAKKADLIFAKSKLLDFCKSNNLPFQEFQNFTQISSYIDQSRKKQNRKAAVLLIHGLTGTPKEMRPIAKHLKNLGYKVEAPMLAGHGLGHEEILATTWQDWVQSARQVLNNLADEFDDIYIVSLSVGGLIGILLAEENSKVKGLVLLSIAYGTPSQGTPQLKCLLPLVFKFPFLRKRLFWTEGPPFGIKNKRLQQNIEKIMKISNNGETTEHGFFRTYVESLYQHKLLENEVKKRAINVSCPALIIHSFEDTMLSPSNAVSIYQDLATNHKIIKFITGCDHVMTVDLKKNEIVKEIEFFIKNPSGSESEYSMGFQNDLTCEIIPESNLKIVSTMPDLNNVDCDFKSHTVIVKKGELLILSLSVVESRMGFSSLFPGVLRSGFNFLAKFLSSILNPKCLSVQSVYVNKEVEQNFVKVAFEMVFQSVNFLTIDFSAEILSFSGNLVNEEKEILTSAIPGFRRLTLQHLQTSIFIKRNNYILYYLLEAFSSTDDTKLFQELEMI